MRMKKNTTLLLFVSAFFFSRIYTDPSLCQDQSTVGYSNWVTLKADIESAQSSASFIICPDTDFSLDDENTLDNENKYIWFGSDTSTISLKCGNDGSKLNNCVIRGGHTHIYMKHGSDGGVKASFYGIKFENSDRWSVLVMYKCEAEFVDCEWNMNTNLWLQQTQTTPWPAVVNGDTSSVLKFTNCIFSGNIGWAGAISSRGYISNDKCIFKNNESRWVQYYGYTNSAIHTIESGDVAVSNSCFIDNDSNGTGTIGLRHDSKLLKNENNFFSGNSVFTEMNSGGFCYEIYKYDLYDGDYCIVSNGPACCELLGPCPTSVPSTEPSTSPSRTPTPSLNPTASLAPSRTPSLNPTTVTSAPSEKPSANSRSFKVKPELSLNISLSLLWLAYFFG